MDLRACARLILFTDLTEGVLKTRGRRDCDLTRRLRITAGPGRLGATTSNAGGGEYNNYRRQPKSPDYMRCGPSYAADRYAKIHLSVLSSATGVGSNQRRLHHIQIFPIHLHRPASSAPSG